MPTHESPTRTRKVLEEVTRMTGATSYELIVPCPKCRRRNRLVSDMIPDDQQVRCSYCAAALGVWRDLKETAKRADFIARAADRSTRAGRARGS